MAAAMGWSRTGISTAALHQLALHGRGLVHVGRALRPARHARRRAARRRPARPRHGDGQPGDHALGQFQILFGVLVGVAAGSFYAPLTATTTRWFTTQSQPRRRAGLRGAQPRLDDDRRRSRAGSSRTTTGAWPCWWSATSRGSSSFPPPCWCASRQRPRPRRCRRDSAPTGRELTAAQALRTPQFAAIALDVLRVLRGPLGPDLPHGHQRDRPRDARRWPPPPCSAWPGLASLGGKIVCGLIADRVGAKRTLVVGLAIQAVAVSLYVCRRASCRASTRSRSCSASPTAA